MTGAVVFGALKTKENTSSSAVDAMLAIVRLGATDGEVFVQSVLGIVGYRPKRR